MTREETKDVLRFLKKLSILAVLLFVLDRSIGSFLAYRYDKNPPPDVRAFNRVVKTPSEDVLRAFNWACYQLRIEHYI